MWILYPLWRMNNITVAYCALVTYSCMSIWCCTYGSHTKAHSHQKQHNDHWIENNNSKKLLNSCTMYVIISLMLNADCEIRVRLRAWLWLPVCRLAIHCQTTWFIFAPPRVKWLSVQGGKKKELFESTYMFVQWHQPSLVSIHSVIFDGWGSI